MGKRYSKNYSNYILRKKYQHTTKGTIWERDWVTIGAQHQIEKGKRPFFGDSGFLFTDNSFPSTQKRHDFGKVVAEWMYDDVKDSNALVNKVVVNYVSNDLRDFAYYGSCSELIRSSIFNIIKWFPACVFGTERAVHVGDETYYLLSNPFEIDFSTEHIRNDEVLNIMRFMSASNDKYELTLEKNGNKITEDISAYNIIWRDEYDINLDKCNDIYELADVEMVSKDGRISISIYLKILSSYGKIIAVEDRDRNEGYKFVELSPKESVINEYFESLEGFEKLLLRNDTVPLYKNRFLKMFDTDNGVRYAYRDYVWPRVNDYCIDIESPSYIAFVESLMDTAIDFDEMWCDNLWRNMTHESLRNYDWTYTKDFNNGDEIDNINGGNRLEKLIRIYGRVFDDIKRYIDGIRFSINITYDGFNNMPSAEISDRLTYNGWEVYTTIPCFTGMDGVDMNDDLSTVYLNDYASTESGSGKPRWFNAINQSDVSAGSNDIDFLRALSLSSKYILMSKGTVCGIDMIMGLFGIGRNEKKENDDNALSYNIKERYFASEAIEYYDIIKSAIGDLVHYDNTSYYYDDPYEGVPFGDIELHDKKYIVPFYENGKYYKGELAFQNNGGWYKKSLDVTNLNDYEETLSYLNVVRNFESLLSVNTFSLEKYDSETEIAPPSDIYYVVDISDYIKYNENLPPKMTHYFYITDIFNPENADSWKPISPEVIDSEDTITQEQYDSIPGASLDYVLIDEVNHIYARKYGDNELFERAVYLDSILSSNIGNNPHTGYGRYDLGQMYKDYITNPFKYYEDNYVLPDRTEEIKYTLKYDTYNDDEDHSNVTITEDTYDGLGYIISDDILFRAKNDIVWVVSISDEYYDEEEGENVKTLIIDFNTALIGTKGIELIRNVSLSGADSIKTDGDITSITITGNTSNINRIIKQVPNANYIYYYEFIRIEDAKKKLYSISIKSLNEAFSNASPSGHLSLKEFYIKLNYYFDDFIFGVTEYDTENKVKNISDTMRYAPGYLTEITKEEYDALPFEEKNKWHQEIASINDDGSITSKYVFYVDESTYNEMSDEEKKKYYQIVVTKYTKDAYRDSEDSSDGCLDETDINNPDKAQYYHNSKVITIEFNNTNRLFERYFKDVIGKYLMQVMPSTAITVIVFNETEQGNG